MRVASTHLIVIIIKIHVHSPPRLNPRRLLECVGTACSNYALAASCILSFDFDHDRNSDMDGVIKSAYYLSVFLVRALATLRLESHLADSTDGSYRAILKYAFNNWFHTISYLILRHYAHCIIDALDQLELVLALRSSFLV